MRKKKILDLVMAIVMICLMNLSFTGIKVHEILGILVFFLFLYHKAINFKWIKSVTKKLFNKDTKVKMKVMYVVDAILLLFVISTVITGILISTDIVTSIVASDIKTMSLWHHFFAYWFAILLMFHIGLHWEFLRNAMKIKKNSMTEKVVMGISVLLIVFVAFKNNIMKKIMIPHKELNSQHKVEDKKKPDQEVSEDSEEKGENFFDDSTTVTDDPPTIEEHLSKLFCTGCGRHCPLTNPSCKIGANRQAQEVQEYNRLYGTNETYTSQK